MPANDYHFVDHWILPFPIEDVWDVLARPSDYPAWWKRVYLEATAFGPNDGPRVGAKVAVVNKGWLPYKLRSTFETTALERPRLIEFKASGDFTSDGSRWLLRPRDGATEVTLEWNPRVEKPVVKLLSPVLKPLFRWNHSWAMKLGRRQIIEYLSSRRPAGAS